MAGGRLPTSLSREDALYHSPARYGLAQARPNYELRAPRPCTGPGVLAKILYRSADRPPRSS